MCSQPAQESDDFQTSVAWDDFVGFFAVGLRDSAAATRHQMLELVSVQAELKEVIRASALRADSAHVLVDFAVANPSFTVRNVEAGLGVSYGRANKLIGQLIDLGVLDVIDADAYKRRFFAGPTCTDLRGRVVTNFAFVGAADWPEIHDDCARAESYLSADPR